jgi:glycosyltransferase involved in cell wall biosynthesis
MITARVSVLVTTYNHARYVDECLESIRQQTIKDFEIIIVDDASTDGTADRIRAWLDRTAMPARFVPNRQRRGLCANRNYGLAHTRGQFICSLSGDDVYEPDRIERQLTAFDSQPDDVAAVYSDARMVNGDGSLLHPSFLRRHLGHEPLPEGNALFRRLLLRGNFMPAPATMVRRSSLDAVGHYDESLFYEDLYMWLKLSHRFRFHHVEGSLVKYRLLPSSMSQSPRYARQMLECDATVLASWIGRSENLREALIDRLWRIGVTQFDGGYYEDARRTFQAAAPHCGLRRRTSVGLLGLPGASPVLRWARRGARVAWRGARGVARRTRHLGSRPLAREALE